MNSGKIDKLIRRAIAAAIRRADRRWMATPMNPHEPGDIVKIEANRATKEIRLLLNANN